MPRKLSDIGEIGLINCIKKNIKVGRDVIYGIGDDAAVLKYTKDKYLLFTSDMLIEGVHFLLNTDFAKIGHKALACSLSDIAAMGGGKPLFAVVSLGLPPDLSLNSINRLYQEINKLAKKFNVSIVGGDTNRSKNFVIDISMIGEIKKKNLVLRSGACVDDVIFVTGKLGSSLKSGRHLTFMPCINEAQFLTKHIKMNSMIDISDGLALDLARIASASNVGAVLYENYIPKNPDVKSVEDALYTGEDFQLLFTISPNQVNKLISIKDKLKTPITFIGEIRPKNFGLKIVDRFAKERPLLLNPVRKLLSNGVKGFSHF